MVERGSEQAEPDDAFETISVDDALKLVGDPGVVFVDVREIAELHKSGTVPGAIHAPRGSLESIADPGSSDHQAPLSSGKRLVLICGSGVRSAMAGKTLCDMGILNVCHVAGGFGGWLNAAGPVERY